jgi:hypothetical protein
MTNIVENIEKEALVLFLRSKTAFGRLTDAEVHSVLAFLESIGFKQTAQDVAPAAPIIAPPPVVPATILTPDAQVAAQVVQVLPAAPVSALANLESIIEKDVKAFFEPALIAPPPAQ